MPGKIEPDATYTVKIVKDGDPYKTLEMKGSNPRVEFMDTPNSAGRILYRVMVEGPRTAYPEVPESVKLSGNMVGLSNPLYFNFDPQF